MVREYPDRSQRYAVCESQWEKKHAVESEEKPDS
jgi:hypothetical protein